MPLLVTLRELFETLCCCTGALQDVWMVVELNHIQMSYCCTIHRVMNELVFCLNTQSGAKNSVVCSAPHSGLLCQAV